MRKTYLLIFAALSAAMLLSACQNQAGTKQHRAERMRARRLAEPVTLPEQTAAEEKRRMLPEVRTEQAGA